MSEKALQRICRVLTWAELSLGFLLIGISVLLFPFESAGMLIVFAILTIASAFAYHIKVEFLINHLPKRIRPALGVINTALIMLFLGFIAVAGFLWVNLNSGTRSPALELPVNWVFYAALPVAALLGLGYAVARVIGAIIRHKKNAGRE